MIPLKGRSSPPCRLFPIAAVAPVRKYGAVAGAVLSALPSRSRVSEFAVSSNTTATCVHSLIGIADRLVTPWVVPSDFRK